LKTKILKYIYLSLNSMEHRHNDTHGDQIHPHSHPKGFLAESDIQDYFSKNRSTVKPKKDRYPFEDWFKADKAGEEHTHHPFTYGHNEKIGNGTFSCDTLTDEWYRWFLTTPVSENAMTNPSNPYIKNPSGLMDKNGTFVYLAAASPFQEPHDFKRIFLTRKAPLLVPIYNIVASIQDSPSLASDPETVEVNLTEQVKKDLAMINGDTVEAYFDGEPFFGCCVIRNKLLKISNIPSDNVLGIPQDRLQESNFTLELCHGGFWLLIKEEKLTPGDHLLYFKAHSPNYEMRAKLLLTAIY
jgi:hypothetical protein